MTLHTLYTVNAYRFLVCNESEVILALRTATLQSFCSSWWFEMSIFRGITCNENDQSLKIGDYGCVSSRSIRLQWLGKKSPHIVAYYSAILLRILYYWCDTNPFHHFNNDSLSMMSRIESIFQSHHASSPTSSNKHITIPSPNPLQVPRTHPDSSPFASP